MPFRAVLPGDSVAAAAAAADPRGRGLLAVGGKLLRF